MKKILFFICLLWASISFGQTTGFFRYDTVTFEKGGGNSEFKLKNATRGVTGGVLTNMGGGRTAFVTPSASVTASNGLTKTSNDIKLGGTGTANTNIDWGVFESKQTWDSLTIGSGHILSQGTVTVDPSFPVLSLLSLTGANGSSGVKTVAQMFEHHRTGTSSINIGTSYNVSGATNNYAIIVDNGGGSVGIGDETPASLFTVGAGDVFQVNSSGDLVKVNNVSYNWPSSQGGASTVLTNNGGGTLSWGAAGGSTPTLQQVLTAGSTTTQSGTNAVNVNQGTFSFDSAFQFHAEAINTVVPSNKSSIRLVPPDDGTTGLSINYETSLGVNSITMNPSGIQIGLADQDLKITDLQGLHGASDSMMVWNPSTKNVGKRPIPSSGSGLTVGTTAIASGTVNRFLLEGAGNVLYEDDGVSFTPSTNTLSISGPGTSLILMPKLSLNFDSDANAVQSAFAYDHDNTAWLFDAWYNGASFTSSHAGSNFAWYKNGNELIGAFSAGVSAGSTFGSFNTTAGLRLASNGNVGIGVAATSQLHTSGTVRFANFGAGTATFDASGNVTSVSDSRLKYIQGNYRAGLKEIKNINPIIYKWRPESKMETENTYAGFSAQNIKDALGAQATGINKEGYLSVQDRAIMAAMINAIKELSAKVDYLEAELKKKR